MRDLMILHMLQKLVIMKIRHDIDRNAKFACHHNTEKLAIGMVQRKETKPPFCRLIVRQRWTFHIAYEDPLLDICNDVGVGNADPLW